MSRPLTLLAVVAAVLGSPSAARADPPAVNACADAYTRGQIARNAHKLLQARESFRVCAQAACKAFIVKDCTTWLEQVQASMPTVVPLATDEAGGLLSSVKVSMDGALLLDASDGRSVEVDPGPHALTFEAPDGRKVDQMVLVPEGEKDRRIAVTFAKRPSPAAASPSPASVTSSTASGATPAPERSGTPWKSVGLVTAGVGVVGLGLGALFGLEAMAKKSSAGCDSNSVCRSDAAASTLRDAGTAGDLSTAFVIAGGVLAAGGLAIWKFAPSRTVQLAAAGGPRRAGLLLAGTW
jgi:hypothetical protein